MKYTFSILSTAFGVALLSFSAHAACGGGGYHAAAAVSSDDSDHRVVRTEIQAEYKTTEVRSSNTYDSKRDGLQRDVDKAQSKLDNCTGDCDKEKRKLEEAQSRLARRVSSN